MARGFRVLAWLVGRGAGARWPVGQPGSGKLNSAAGYAATVLARLLGGPFCAVASVTGPANCRCTGSSPVWATRRSNCALDSEGWVGDRESS